MLIDSHCHLDFPDFQTRLPGVLAAATAAGVGRMVTISTHIARFETYRALAEAYETVFFTIGTHPHNAAAEPDIPTDRIVTLSAHPRCIAIGEAGLDYHYDKSPHDVQQRVFRTHIDAARETGLPLVIHARNADEDMIRILSEEMRRGRFGAVLHCFSSGPKLAEVGVELGLYVSFSGILTFKNSDDIRRIASAVPRERLLVETDAPYLAPVPHRGKTNEPAYVANTARALAEVIGVSDAEIADITTANFYRLFSKAAQADRLATAS
ncbi:TatD family hydrolase [Microvirga alba]|uniref:TatD family hydrolase n=1 Tax=Microvirga alba TaxID=2791025 RepID=A0A931FPX3_9HYPH|nr:TatD family hydrolase [Microvirga alba]MBF9235399.1 TatD family hydrolase [Microvirga alba]